MIRVAMVAAAALAWACAAAPPVTAPASAPPPPVADDTCGMAPFMTLIGQPESAIPRTQLPPGTRVICYNCAVTQDLRRDRLNIELGPDGRVARVRCG
ncbi:MAG: peptidase inhibitor I78 [Caulobacterales bacterium]